MKSYSAKQSALVALLIVSVFQTARVSAVNDVQCLANHFTTFFQVIEKIDGMGLDTTGLPPEAVAALAASSNLEKFKKKCNDEPFKSDLNNLKTLIETTFLAYKDTLFQDSREVGSPKNPKSSSQPSTSITPGGAEHNLELQVKGLLTKGILDLCDNIKNDTALCSLDVRKSIPLLEKFRDLFLKTNGDDAKTQFSQHCDTIPDH